MTEGLRISELFAGTGNFAKGFSSYGYTVFANDHDKFVKQTYDANHKTPMVLGDVWDVIGDMPEHDLLLAGFPCTPFSSVGTRQGMKDAKRGELFFAIAEALQKHKPRYFVLENVRGIMSTNGGSDFRQVLDTLAMLGYSVSTFIMSPDKHANIPQSRERVFFVGFRDRDEFVQFRYPSKLPLSKNFRDFLEEAPDEKYYYRNGNTIYPRLLEAVVRDDRVYYVRRAAEVREIKSGLVPTLMANMGKAGNAVPIIRDADRIRKLTIRECARFQGMGNDYIFPVSNSQAYKQIGNAVNVAVISRIADAMFGGKNDND